MSKFFSYNNPICIEGHTPRVFSYDPSIISLKELLLFEIKQIAYYIMKLEDLGTDISDVRNKVIKFISYVIVNLDFKRDKFNKIIEDLKKEKKKLEEKYLKTCEEKNAVFQPLKIPDELAEGKIDIIIAINEGEKQSFLKNTSISKTKKNLYEIISTLIQNACIFLVELENYGKKCPEGEEAVIKLLNSANFISLSEDKLKSKIKNFTEVNNKIMKKLKNTILNKYGPVEESEVDLSIKEGKCILVSGHFLKDLELVLEAVKDTDINVYTHTNLLLAHSLHKFKQYPNLAGHYQRSMNNLQLDFASFPGAVLMTQNSQPHVDVIRGRIFTFDKNPAFGIAGIDEENLEPLIKAANDAKGFKKDIEINKINVGYSIQNVNDKLDKIIENIKNGDIKRLFIIDMLNNLSSTGLYVENLLSNMPDDTFAISLSYNKEKENVWHINSYTDSFVFFDILKKLKENFDFNDLDLTIFLTKCDMYTISYIAYLKSLNIKRIYLGNCCPTEISPSLVEGMKEVFGISYISENPVKDLKDIENN